MIVRASGWGWGNATAAAPSKAYQSVAGVAVGFATAFGAGLALTTNQVYSDPIVATSPSYLQPLY